MRFDTPITLSGFTALSVDTAISRETPASSAASHQPISPN